MSGIESKAHRMLCGGRVRVIEAGHGTSARAEVVGDHGQYQVIVGDKGAVCSCPAFTRRCSHALAVELVVEAGP
jgi:hypothetical protein